MRILVTGGAGFIGSHLVESHLNDGCHELVVLDDMSTGSESNLLDEVRLVRASVEDIDAVRKSMTGVDLVFHQAASRAVLRSVDDPIGTDRANTGGTLNVLVAARDAGVRRVVLASSSSVYGGVAPVPTAEDAPLAPKSPYAVSKLACEHYARVFHELFDIETIALRYFNVFGPRQRPDSPYAAVIPLFMEALTSGRSPEIHGDGLQSRDFTYIDDVVVANRLAATVDATVVSGNVYNIAHGDTTTVMEVFETLRKSLACAAEPTHVAPRPGDIRRSQADASAARRDLGFACEVSVTDGLRRTVDWFLAESALP